MSLLLSNWSMQPWQQCKTWHPIIYKHRKRDSVYMKHLNNSVRRRVVRAPVSTICECVWHRRALLHNPPPTQHDRTHQHQPARTHIWYTHSPWSAATLELWIEIVRWNGRTTGAHLPCVRANTTNTRIRYACHVKWRMNTTTTTTTNTYLYTNNLRQRLWLQHPAVLLETIDDFIDKFDHLVAIQIYNRRITSVCVKTRNIKRNNKRRTFGLSCSQNLWQTHSIAL